MGNRREGIFEKQGSRARRTFIVDSWGCSQDGHSHKESVIWGSQVEMVGPGQRVWGAEKEKSQWGEGSIVGVETGERRGGGNRSRGKDMVDYNRYPS